MAGSFGYTPATYRWSKWPASYQILPQFCWLITETILACLSQSVFLLPASFFPRTTANVLSRLLSRWLAVNSLSKNTSSGRKKESRARTAIDPAHSEKCFVHKPPFWIWNCCINVMVMPSPSASCLLPLALYFPFSLCSEFIHQAQWFQRVSRLCSLPDWLCHLPPATTAVLHLFINAFSACSSFCDTDCLRYQSWPCCLACCCLAVCVCVCVFFLHLS